MTPQPTDAIHALPHDLMRHPNLGVEVSQTASAVVALARIEAGSVLLHAEGVVTGTPSRYSLQIGERSHLDLPPGTCPSQLQDKYLWRYLNHSCRPNAYFEGLDLIALKTIHAGEMVAFNYNTTELEMAEPFVCGCSHCNGATISGFANLIASEQKSLAPFAASHLRRHMIMRDAG